MINRRQVSKITTGNLLIQVLSISLLTFTCLNMFLLFETLITNFIFISQHTRSKVVKLEYQVNRQFFFLSYLRTCSCCGNTFLLVSYFIYTCLCTSSYVNRVVWYLLWSVYLGQYSLLAHKDSDLLAICQLTNLLQTQEKEECNRNSQNL